MKARYYIYRNLRTKGFSVRYQGRVIDRPFTFTAEDVEFKVNEKGRQKVLKDHQKNVHAFVVTDKYTAKKYPILNNGLLDRPGCVRYNPYSAAYFVCDGKRIDKAKEVVFQNGLCFVVK